MGWPPHRAPSDNDENNNDNNTNNNNATGTLSSIQIADTQGGMMMMMMILENLQVLCAMWPQEGSPRMLLPLYLRCSPPHKVAICSVG